MGADVSLTPDQYTLDKVISSVRIPCIQDVRHLQKKKQLKHHDINRAPLRPLFPEDSYYEVQLDNS